MSESFFSKPRLFCPGPTPVAEAALPGLHAWVDERLADDGLAG